MTNNSIFIPETQTPILRKATNVVVLGVADVLQTERFEQTIFAPLETVIDAIIVLTNDFMYILNSVPKLQNDKVYISVKYQVQLRWLTMKPEQVRSINHHSDEFVIELESTAKSLHLRTKSQDIYRKWVSELQSLVLHRDFIAKYAVKEYIGSGATSKVYKIQNQVTLVYYACKRIQKSDMTDPSFYRVIVNEISVLTKLKGCSEVVQLIEVQETTNSVYIITELLEGGRITQPWVKYTPEDVGVLTSFLLRAINTLDSRGIVHRDLKPSNILLKYIDMGIGSNTIKLIDFGFSIERWKPMVKDTHLRCGTAGYIPPDALDQSRENIDYSRWDVFSIGVILYNAMTGARLFFDPDNKVRLKMNQEACIDYNNDEFIRYPKECKLMRSGVS